MHLWKIAVLSLSILGGAAAYFGYQHNASCGADCPCGTDCPCGSDCPCGH